MTEHAAQSAYHLLSRIDIFQLTTHVQRKCNCNSIKKANDAVLLSWHCVVNTLHVGLISVRVYTPNAVPDLIDASILEPSAACNAICSLFNYFCLVANKLPEVQQSITSVPGGWLWCVSDGSSILQISLHCLEYQTIIKRQSSKLHVLLRLTCVS